MITKEELIREVYPVVKMIHFGSGCYEVIRKCKGKINARKTERGTIKMLSKKSLLRLMFMMQCTEIKFRSMLTLTYPKQYPTDGKIVKADVSAMLQKVRRSGYKYLWFLEFQKRGAPHIHMMLDVDCVTPRMRVSYGLYWTERIALSNWFAGQLPPERYVAEVMKMARFNTHRDVWSIIRNTDGARNYVTKYASKERQKKVPAAYVDVGRFWGSSRGLQPKGVEFDITEDDVEKWLVDNGHPAKDYYLVPRFLWGAKPIETAVPKSLDTLI